MIPVSIPNINQLPPLHATQTVYQDVKNAKTELPAKHARQENSNTKNPAQYLNVLIPVPINSSKIHLNLNAINAIIHVRPVPKEPNV